MEGKGRKQNLKNRKMKTQIVNILLDYMQEFIANHRNMQNNSPEARRLSSLEITEKTADKILHQLSLSEGKKGEKG